jgi:hypothetical protein
LEDLISELEVRIGIKKKKKTEKLLNQTTQEL